MLARLKSLIIGADASPNVNPPELHRGDESTAGVASETSGRTFNAEIHGDGEASLRRNHAREDGMIGRQPYAQSNDREQILAKEPNRLKEKRRHGIGAVTVLENNLAKGTVDVDYYFRKEKFEDLLQQGLCRGKRVEYEAVLPDGEINWEIVSMKFHLTKEELERQELRRFKTIVGSVLDFVEVRKVALLKYGRTGDEIQEIPYEALPQDYSVIKGDFLRVKIEAFEINDDNNIGKILSVEPSRKKTVVGKVTLNRYQQFSVNNHIYFENGVWRGTKLPRVNDAVRAVAVESRFDSRFNWRAISVRPSKYEEYSAPDKQEEGWLATESSWTTPLNELLSDKLGITIQPPKVVNFNAVRVGLRSEMQVLITNMGKSRKILKSIRVQNDQSVCKFGIKFVSGTECEEIAAVLDPGSKYEVMISCSPVQFGATRELCVFDFGDFKIARHLVVNALSNEDNLLRELSKGNECQERREMPSKEDIINDAMEDSKKQTISASVRILRLPFFQSRKIDNKPIPPTLWQIVKDCDDDLLLQNYPNVRKPLKIETYQDKFEVGLWLEELQNQIIRRQFDVKDTTLERAGDCLKFEVPHLRDIHPALQVGDPLTIHDHNETTKKYTTFIHEIRGNHIYIKFDGRDENAVNNYVTVEFNLSRTNYKRCHNAIDQAVKFLGENWLFPSQSITIKPPRIPFFEDDENEDNSNDDDSQSPTREKNGQFQNNDDEEPGTSTSFFDNSKRNVPKIPRSSYGLGNSRKDSRRMRSTKNFISDTKGPDNLKTIKLKWFNVLLNEEQKHAVRRILRGQGRPLPYIIFGPPGTGKTVTVVEALMQIYKLDPNSRILVTAPTNSAADVITEQLVKSKQFLPGDFIRLVGFLRQELQIPESIRDFCCDGEYLDAVARHRLIVSTCTTAGQFVALGLDISGHFTHVLVDEVGYCTEPEAMIAATLCALSKEGQVILAGDPKQLGPVLMSDVAAKCGLSLSLLERLMSLPLYSRNVAKFPDEKYNPIVLTKLVKNYRAHETLLSLPSRLFYDDELQPAASENEVDLCQSLELLGKSKGVPIIFHGVQGRSEREDDSPSWYNKAEILQVLNYVRGLKNFGLTDDDIGIITPYRKQVDKLRRALQLGLLQDEVPKVGSVEEFQGGERKVMIMSLVRSVPKNQSNKVVDRMSFIFSPKRFNVAITRARALLIVIGNPHIIAYDQNWHAFLEYCLDLNCYVGCDLPTQLDQFTQDFIQSLRNEVENDNGGEEQSSLFSASRRNNAHGGFPFATEEQGQESWD